ncbi:MMPL family transporter [Oceanobacillus luteolus]|uniref:MMPL family transporter n=1 Tax=Oceanobacillus luteolus TaxID=1274358 RepID=A0ABW4HMU6_9BACI
MLKRIASLLQNFPIKSIFITIIIVILLVIGVKNVHMATGNDTLVKSSTDVYQDNLMLEEEFGGESVIVLYESDNLLTPENLAHMKGLESAIQMNDSIYSILSPVTLVEEIANKQSENFQEGIVEVIDGLDTMGNKLIEIGTEMGENAQGNQELEFPQQDGLELPDLGGEGIELPEFDSPELPEFGEIQLPDIEGQLAELNQGFSKLIDAQENLGDGTENLINGYVQFGTKTKELAENLSVLANQIEENPEQAKQLQEVSVGLNQLSQQMVEVSENTTRLPEISTQTINGLQNMQEKLSDQLNEQKKQQEQMQKEQNQMQAEMEERLKQEQAEKEAKMQEEMQRQQKQKQKNIEEKMIAQQNEKEKEMQEFKEKMEGKLGEQAKNLGTLSEGLTEMGENLLTISENMETIHSYSDIMKPGLPTKQATLDNMVYDNGELRSMFKEVIVDDRHMIMMIRFEGDTTDVEKSEVVSTINDYLDKEKMDNVETIVSGKPVLDNGIRLSMQESIQKMMGLALLIMVFVLFIVFKVQWRLMSLLTVIIAVIGTVGLMGWLNIPITMVSMAVFPILIGLGIDYGIQFQNRYAEEMLKEDSDE